MSEGRVLEDLAKEPEISLLYGHAHEAAHFWWRFGSGQGDWINEAFAEYFALIAIREIQGENAFRQALDERRERVRALPADAPALAVVPAFSGGDGYTIRYEKGALMLEAFRSHLGDNAFFDTCRRFYERFNARSAGTDDFRAFWSEALKDDAPLRSWLDSSGRGPVPVR
jgi:aminopeptidase N